MTKPNRQAKARHALEQSSRKWRADLGLLLVAAMWGLTFPAIRSAMSSGTSSFAFVATRFGIAAIVMLPFALRGLKKDGRALALPSLGLGLLLGSSYLMQTIGLETTTAANSGFVTGTSVIMVPFLDAAIRKTKLRGFAIAGAGLALLGMYLLAGLEFSSSSNLSSARIGDLWTLASALGYALYLVLLQKHLKRFGHWSFLTAQLFVVALSALLIGPFIEEWQLAWQNQSVVLSIVYCAIFATIGTGLLQFRFQAQSSPVRAAVLFAMDPVFAAIFAVILLNENPGDNAISGGALIILGVLLAELGPNLRKKTER
jgi:drug/metabolite transporter (DMT)-like permease